jgi:hypothetical protein
VVNFNAISLEKSSVEFQTYMHKIELRERKDTRRCLQEYDGKFGRRVRCEETHSLHHHDKRGLSALIRNVGTTPPSAELQGEASRETSLFKVTAMNT